MFKITAYGIILDNEKKILLCHRKDLDLWNLPGGHAESGETPWDAALREVEEETGMTVEINRLSGIYSKPNVNELVFQYICSPKAGVPTPNEESDEIKYFEIDNIPANTPPKQVERIKDAIEHPEELIMKKQFGRPAFEIFGEKK